MYDCATTCYDFSLENKKILIYMFFNFYRHEIKKKMVPRFTLAFLKKSLYRKTQYFFYWWIPTQVMIGSFKNKWYIIFITWLNNAIELKEMRKFSMFLISKRAFIRIHFLNGVASGTHAKKICLVDSIEEASVSINMVKRE